MRTYVIVQLRPCVCVRVCGARVRSLVVPPVRYVQSVSSCSTREQYFVSRRRQQRLQGAAGEKGGRPVFPRSASTLCATRFSLVRIGFLASGRPRVCVPEEAPQPLVCGPHWNEPGAGVNLGRRGSAR